MKTIHRLLVRHAFKGGRFDDHGVDLDVLPDLTAYKNILVETAKELWRSKNLDRERLPWHFEESVVLKFYTVEPGSAVIPIERVMTVEDQVEIWKEKHDELDEAVELVAAVADAGGHDRSLPPNFPSRILPMFEGYGKTLRDDEYFEYQLRKDVSPVRYDKIARERLIQRAAADYEDSVDIVGTVTMASVRRPKLGITLQDGREIEATFQPEDEATVLAALSEHNTARLKLEGRGLFKSGGVLHKIIETTKVTLLPSGQLPFVEGTKPIWKVMTDLAMEMPLEHLKNIPRDGSVNHDHYLYGYPKREE